MSIHEQINDYDWEQAFEYAYFEREDVAEIIALSDGERDGNSWIGVFKLRDGRFGWVTAKCDYTGWECKASGHSAVCASLDDLILGHVGLENAKHLGLPWPGV